VRRAIRGGELKLGPGLRKFWMRYNGEILAEAIAKDELTFGDIVVLDGDGYVRRIRDEDPPSSVAGQVYKTKDRLVTVCVRGNATVATAAPDTSAQPLDPQPSEPERQTPHE